MLKKDTIRLVKNLNKKAPKGMRFKSQNSTYIDCTFKCNKHSVKIRAVTRSDILFDILKGKAYETSINMWVTDCVKIFGITHKINLAYNLVIRYDPIGHVGKDSNYLYIQSFSDTQQSYILHRSTFKTLLIDDMYNINSICGCIVRRFDSTVRDSVNKSILMPNNESCYIGSHNLYAIYVDYMVFVHVKNSIYCVRYSKDTPSYIADLLLEVEKYTT